MRSILLAPHTNAFIYLLSVVMLCTSMKQNAAAICKTLSEEIAKVRFLCICFVHRVSSSG